MGDFWFTPHSCSLEKQNSSNLLLTPSGLELQKWSTSQTKRSGGVWCWWVGLKAWMGRCLWHLWREIGVAPRSRWVVIWWHWGRGGAWWGEGTESLSGAWGRKEWLGREVRMLPGSWLDWRGLNVISCLSRVSYKEAANLVASRGLACMMQRREDYLWGNLEWWGLQQTRNHKPIYEFALPQGRKHLMLLDLMQKREGGNWTY